MSTANFTKLSGIVAGAQVNQNAFSNVAVGNVTVAADNATDTLTLVAGTKITLTPDATNDTITISADEEPYQVMSTSEMTTGTSETARSMTAKNLKTGLKSLLLELVYPVGSFYVSSKNVSPQTFLGGTWAARSGYMLRAATSSVTFNTNNKTGGNDSVSYTPAGTNSGGAVASHTLTINQIPSHQHVVGYAGNIYAGNGPTGYWAGFDGPATPYTKVVEPAGGGQGHTHGFTNPTFTGTAATINTIPNYRNVYMWERTS